jgi:hypothetical protein
MTLCYSRYGCLNLIDSIWIGISDGRAAAQGSTHAKPTFGLHQSAIKLPPRFRFPAQGFNQVFSAPTPFHW